MPTFGSIVLGPEQRHDIEVMCEVYRVPFDKETGRPDGFFQDPFGKKDFQGAVLKSAMPRVLFAVVFYFLGVYINNLSQAWLQHYMEDYYESRWAPIPPFGNKSENPRQREVSEYRNGTIKWTWPHGRPARKDFFTHPNTSPTLWDVVFEYLPYVPSSTPADVFAGMSTLVAFVRFAVVPGPFSMRWTFLTRGLVIWGFIFLCRAFTIVVTPLPNPYLECVPKISFPNNIWMEAFANLPLFGAGYDELTCQDVMFSGHTAMGTLWTTFLLRYRELAPWFYHRHSNGCSSGTIIDLCLMLWLVFGWYVIIASHFHYTVDVLVGILITFMSFGIYHSIAKLALIKDGNSCNALFAPTLRWLEKHSKDLRYWKHLVVQSLATTDKAKTRMLVELDEEDCSQSYTSLSSCPVSEN